MTQVTPGLLILKMQDKEPERYYDWMLWKMRQEDQKEKQVKADIGLDKIKEVEDLLGVGKSG